jgi:cell division protein FtsZ
MVDEKLGEQVWITVVATGYGDKPAPRRDERAPGLREPAGEPRVSRMSRPQRDTRIDVDVPEFMPRF